MLEKLLYALSSAATITDVNIAAGLLLEELVELEAELPLRADRSGESFDRELERI